MKPPFAERLRPDTLNDFVGQAHLVGPRGALRKFLDRGHIQSMLFWGPPGTGKTTLARILSRTLQMQFLVISATQSGAKELKEIGTKAQALGSLLLFIDEIHRFNKLQQDILLPYVEHGTLILIGSTTENPAFSVNKAILSRCIVFRFEPLTPTEIDQALTRAVDRFALDIPPDIRNRIAHACAGDLRKGLNLLEAVSIAGSEAFSEMNRTPIYDRLSDAHYDHASALQKSMRGGDADASIYWLAKMLEAGEDPAFIARRILVCAAEDVGNADPTAVLIADAALRAVQQLGLPEARIHLAQAVIYIAKAPKSNETIRAIDAASADVRNGRSYPVPPHLRDAHYASATSVAGIKGYVYTHDHPFQHQSFLPPELTGTRYTSDLPLHDLPDPVRTRIIDWLTKHRNEPLQIGQMARELGYPTWALKKALRALAHQGLIRLNPDSTVNCHLQPNTTDHPDHSDDA